MKSLKEKIQRWLNIETKQEIFRHFDSQKFNETSLRPLIAEAIQSLLKGESVYGYSWVNEDTTCLKTIIRDGVDERVKLIIKSETEKYLKGEEFIDRVVTRINNKQLN